MNNLYNMRYGENYIRDYYMTPPPEDKQHFHAYRIEIYEQ